jgi:glycosyltransferase involved in cell wall biosynthesis
MKIIIISCVAPPETNVAGRVNWDIAIDQAKKGNEVVIITPKPSRPIGKFENIEAFDKITDNGIRHICIDSFIYPKNGLLGRMLESFSFGFKSAHFINKNNINADIIYCMPWPFLGQYIFLKKLKNKSAKIIMNVQDLYPESFIHKFNSRFIVKMLNPLKAIDKFIANSSDHLSVVSNSIKEVYIKLRKIDENKVSVIENWQDESPFLTNVSLSKLQILKKHDLDTLENKFINLYLGNIGPVAGVEDILNDMIGVDCNSNIAIIIAGSGTCKVKCELIVKQNNIKNVFFVNLGTSIDSVVELQSIADVLLLPIKEGSAQSSIPSKLIAYMFSERPILSSADIGSFTADAIVNSNSGWIIYNKENWHSKMIELSLIDKSILSMLGKNAREYSLQNFSKSKGLEKINALFKKLIINQ